jgi:threonine dehydrogenase-like Zn-dependent dehydrogenase
MNVVKAAVWTGASKIEVQDIPLPKVMDDGMLVRVNAAGVCGTDINLFPQEPPYPAILGHEFTATIVEMGKDAGEQMKSFSGELKVGDRISLYPWLTCGRCPQCLRFGEGSCSVCENSFVYGVPYERSGLTGVSKISSDIGIFPYLKGGFAEYVYIMPGTYIWKVPDDMPDTVATLLDPMAVAMRAIELAIRAPGPIEESFHTNSTILVIGDGQIGILTALIAKLMGVRNVVISGIYDSCLKNAKDISGADYVMNSLETSFEERKRKMLEMTDGFGADVVFECVGNTKGFRDGVELMNRAGTFVEVGNMVETAPVQFDLAQDLCVKHATYVGMSINTPTAFDKAFGILKRHKSLKLQSLYTHRCDLYGLNDMLTHGRDRDYVKGLVEFKK